MATTPVLFQAPTGKTLTADLYPRTSDTAAATSLTCTEATNADGFYLFNVTTATTGIHKVIIREGGTSIGTYWADLNDTTTQHECGDDLYALLLSADIIAATVVQSIQNNSDAIIASLSGGNSIERRRGDTWVMTFTIDGDVTGSSDFWFSMKDGPNDTEDNAVLRVSETVGLERIIKGTVAASSLATTDASIATAYDGGDDETTVTVTVKPAATVLIEADNTNANISGTLYPTPRTPQSLPIIASDFYYDVQEIDSSSVVTTRYSGQFRNRADVTKATS